MTRLVRETRETTVRVTLQVGHAAAPAGDRTAADAAEGEISTTDPFLDHMLHTLRRYSGMHLAVEAAGDLRHHVVEDVGITVGAALHRATPPACARYGSATVPMDDALVQAVLDLGGRSWYEGRLPVRRFDHFLQSLAANAGMTLHVRVLRGRDRHHVVEAAFKALGLALRQALAAGDAVFSTKGAVRMEQEEER